MSRLAAVLATIVVLAALAGCGRGTSPDPAIGGDKLTIYSSLPLSGPLAPVARDVRRAQQLALAEAGGRAGEFAVSVDFLDSASERTGRWTPERIAANARIALDDRQTVAYLGEIEHGASTVSAPLLNAAGILQVSPRDTYLGLTAAVPGGPRDEPARFFPSGRRTFARVVPADDRQARVLAGLLLRERARRVVLVDDRRPGPTVLAGLLARALGEADGVRVVGRVRLDPEAPVPGALLRTLRRTQADAMVYAGRGGPFAARVLRRVGARAPGVRLVGTDDLAFAPAVTFARVPDRLGARLVGVAAAPAADAAFRRRFRAAFGSPPNDEAIHGYRAMRLALTAIRRAGARGGRRGAVVRAALAAAPAEPPARFVVLAPGERPG